MKRIFFTTLLALLAWAANAQIVQINPYVGWTTSSALQLYYGKVRTTDGINYGGNLSFGKGMSSGGFTQNAFVELQYNYLKTDLEYRSYTGGVPDQALGDIAMHNIMIGGTKESGNEKVTGYGGTYLGATIFDPSDNRYNNQTRFTLSFGAGLKYYASPKIGLRFHAQMYMPIWGSDYYVGWSPGGGASTGIVATAVNVYANFNAGIFLNINKAAQ
jgi:hypothetical protein